MKLFSCNTFYENYPITLSRLQVPKVNKTIKLIAHLFGSNITVQHPNDASDFSPTIHYY